MKRESKIYLIVSLIFIFIAIIEGIFLVELSNRNERNKEKEINNTISEKKENKKEEKKIPDEIIPEGSYIKIPVEDNFNYEEYDKYGYDLVFKIESNGSTYEEWFCDLIADGYTKGYLIISVSEGLRNIYDYSETLDYLSVSIDCYRTDSGILREMCKPPLQEEFILEYIEYREINPSLDYGVHYNLNYTS